MRLLSTKIRLAPYIDRERFVQMALLELGKDKDCSLDFSGFSLESAGKDTQFKNEFGTESVELHNFDQVLILEVNQVLSDEVRRVCTFVLRDKDETPSLYVSMDKETTSMDVELDGAFDVPSLLKRVLWMEWGGEDVWIPTDDKAHLIRRGDVVKAASLFNRKEDEKEVDRLFNPVVYLSVDHDGRCNVDADELALALAGCAHVLREASPVVSGEMAARITGRIPTSGDAAVLFPGCEMVLIAKTEQMGQEICKLVLRRLLQISVDDAYNAAKLKNQNLAATIADSIGDKVLSDTFEAVLNEKQQRLSDLEEENRQLLEEVTRLRAKAANLQNGFEKAESQKGGKFITLDVTEGELYEGELKDVVLKALSQVLESMPSELTRVRKYHVLSDVLERNFPCQTDARLTECIRGAIEDGVLTRPGIGRLRAAGFIVDDDTSGHIKVSRMAGDKKYTSIFACSPSDKSRGGKNFVSEISNMLFGY